MSTLVTKLRYFSIFYNYPAYIRLPPINDMCLWKNSSKKKNKKCKSFLSKKPTITNIDDLQYFPQYSVQKINFLYLSSIAIPSNQ